jgi:hypothetical protein
MPSQVELLLEAERRGILPPEKQPLLNEARNRGLIPSATLEESTIGITPTQRQQVMPQPAAQQGKLLPRLYRTFLVAQ